jgi:hypothetical protein
VVSIWRAHQPGETIALNAIDLGVSEAAAIAVRGHRVAVVDLDPPNRHVPRRLRSWDLASGRARNHVGRAAGF